MKPDHTLVRDALPLERLSCALIRQWLADDADLGAWSRNQPGAIRPRQLAALIRDRIWEAHDLTLATVRQRLEGGGDGQQIRQADYWVKVAIEKQPDQEAKVVSRTRFSLASSGRICAELQIVGGGRDRPITAGPVALRRRAQG